MKKIVALVLSLVMVLGLATTAFAAASTNYNSKEISLKDWAYTDLATGTTVAFENTDKGTVYTFSDVTTETNGVKVTEYGTTVYGFDGLYGVVVAKDSATYQLETADGKFIYVYGFDQDAFDAASGRTAIVIDAFVEKVEDAECGEAYADYFVSGKKFYAPGTDTVAYFKGEFVMVDEDYETQPPVMPHAFMTDAIDECKWTVKDDEPVSVKCVCGDSFKIVDSIAGMKAGTYFALEDGYYVVLAATTTPDADATDKVESAETFDAGIAMYVGMSVMAAAGSAVVLKKKD